MEDLAQVVQVVARDPDQEVLLEVPVLAVQDPVLGAQQGAWNPNLDQEVQWEAGGHGPDHDREVQRAVEIPDQDQDQGHQQVVPDREVGHLEAGVGRRHAVNQGLAAGQDPVVDPDLREAVLVVGLDQEVGPGVNLDLLPVEKAVSCGLICTNILQC